MAEAFIGEIRVVPYNFAPVGWAYCNGQVLPINQNTALFSLLGTNYGGDEQGHLRPAESAGQRADPARAGARPVAL